MRPTLLTLLAVLAWPITALASGSYSEELLPTDDSEGKVAVPPNLNLSVTTTTGTTLTNAVPVDSNVNAISSLRCYNVNNGIQLSKCDSAVLDKIKPFPTQDKYCCRVKWQGQTDMTDVTDAGQTISPPQAMSKIQCQQLRNGQCPAWPATNAASMVHEDTEVWELILAAWLVATLFR